MTSDLQSLADDTRDEFARTGARASFIVVVPWDGEAVIASDLMAAPPWLIRALKMLNAEARLSASGDGGWDGDIDGEA